MACACFASCRDARGSTVGTSEIYGHVLKQPTHSDRGRRCHSVGRAREIPGQRLSARDFVLPQEPRSLPTDLTLMRIRSPRRSLHEQSSDHPDLALSIPSDPPQEPSQMQVLLWEGSSNAGPRCSGHAGGAFVEGGPIRPRRSAPSTNRNGIAGA